MGLMKEIEGLSLEEKIELSAELIELIAEEKKIIKAQREATAQRLKDRICELVGIQYDAEDRHREFIVARTILADTLQKRGYSQRETARILGKDHAAIYHMNKKLAEWKSVPMCYRQELELLNKINSQI